MKRYILIVFLSFLSMCLYAQSGMTDNQVMEYITREHARAPHSRRLSPT